MAGDRVIGEPALSFRRLRREGRPVVPPSATSWTTTGPRRGPPKGRGWRGRPAGRRGLVRAGRVRGGGAARFRVPTLADQIAVQARADAPRRWRRR